METVPDWLKVIASIVTGLAGIIIAFLTIAKLYMKPILDGIKAQNKTMSEMLGAQTETLSGLHDFAPFREEVRREHALSLSKLDELIKALARLEGRLQK